MENLNSSDMGGRESGSRSPMRKEAEAKLIISFQSQQERSVIIRQDQMDAVQQFALQNRFKIIHKFHLDGQRSALQRCSEWVEMLNFKMQKFEFLSIEETQMRVSRFMSILDL